MTEKSADKKTLSFGYLCSMRVVFLYLNFFYIVKNGNYENLIGGIFAVPNRYFFGGMLIPSVFVSSYPFPFFSTVTSEFGSSTLALIKESSISENPNFILDHFSTSNQLISDRAAIPGITWYIHYKCCNIFGGLTPLSLCSCARDLSKSKIGLCS